MEAVDYSHLIDNRIFTVVANAGNAKAWNVNLTRKIKQIDSAMN